MCRAATGMPKECVPEWDWRNWRGTTSRPTISACSLRLLLLKVLKISEEMTSCFLLPSVLTVFSMNILYTPGLFNKICSHEKQADKNHRYSCLQWGYKQARAEKRKASSVAVVVNIYPALWTKPLLQFDSLHSNCTYSFFFSIALHISELNSWESVNSISIRTNHVIPRSLSISCTIQQCPRLTSFKWKGWKGWPDYCSSGIRPRHKATLNALCFIH